MRKGDTKSREGKPGHGVVITADLDLDLAENALPELYYGASREDVIILLEMGIKPLRQRYVHFKYVLRESA